MATTSSIARECLHDLASLRDGLLAAEVRHSAAIGRVRPEHRAAATNLVHYLELRRRDRRHLQQRLASIGVSSFAHAEAHVLGAVDTVLAVLRRLDGDDVPVPRIDTSGHSALLRASERLLGPERPERSTRVMVTLPSEAAHDGALVESFVAAGMDLARINCAHDDPPAWRRMAAHVRSCSPCRVAMDLAGPKLRTGPIEPGPPVRRAKPPRDALGRTVRPARVRLVGPSSNAEVAPASLGVDAIVPVRLAPWLARRQPGDVIAITDARERHRRWRVVEVGEGWCTAEADRTTYVVPGTRLEVATPQEGPHAHPPDEPALDVSHVGPLPGTEQRHRVHSGDLVVLTRDLTPAPASPPGATEHRIGCTLAEAFRDCRPGERVWFDDGRIPGEIEAVDTEAGSIHVRVGAVRERGVNLRGGKGINLPDTSLELPALTDKDREDLREVVAVADIVDLSFVEQPSDVAELLDALRDLGGEHLGVVLKIETRRAFDQLPALLLEAMRHDLVGVMIARGDLAVEVGFERLAEVQEEVLWLCEAAHVPVIWATQVLDSMARSGQPSRAEISDAATAHRAECVILNKGPHIVEAIAALGSILERMREHQRKKHSLLRGLRAWRHALDD